MFRVVPALTEYSVVFDVKNLATAYMTTQPLGPNEFRVLAANEPGNPVASYVVTFKEEKDSVTVSFAPERCGRNKQNLL